MKGSGWHALSNKTRNGDFTEEIIPSAWDNLLTEMNITQQGALWEVKLKTENGFRLRSWVNRNFKRKFVPIEVLDIIRGPED